MTEPTLSDAGNLTLACLHQHRLLTTSQLHALVNADRALRRTQHLLASLGHRDLVASVARRGGRRGHERVWHLTPNGATVVQAAPTDGEPRRKPITAAIAAGPLQRHTIAVNDACLTFMRAARKRGDDCGPLAWRHEVAHPIGSKRSDVVIADAVLRYLSTGDDGQLCIDYRFVELDRATVTVDQLATKLTRYTRLATYSRTPGGAPAWREQYLALPDLIVVLADAPCRRLRLRLEHLASLTRAVGGLGVDPVLRVFVCLLEELTSRGPDAPVFTRLDAPDELCDWLGDSEGRV